MRFIAPSRSDVWGRLAGGPGAVLSKKRQVPEVYRSLMRT
jgi:hypothetical protein